jgi:hypothetical protein
MSTTLRLVVLLALLAGCVPSVDTEEEVSTRYDTIPCSALAAQRDAIRAKYPVLPPEKGEQMAMGAFAGVRDALEAGGHDERVARGKIRAMNDSLRRRACAGAPKPEPT